MKTKFAIGCLVQWYECDIIEEYVDSLKDAIESYDGQVIVDFTIVGNQDLEKCISEEQMNKCIEKIESICNMGNVRYTEDLETIADYRRLFNTNYCDDVDVLIWGESDAILPKQMFIILNNLHKTSLQNNNPKYLAFFGICKMWDDSWKLLEHPDFTDKPFIEMDTKNWWSLRYAMNQEEMEEINNRTQNLNVQIVNPYKFNGCGLVISSEVVKSGVNIPKSVFFIHEDTAFMNVMQNVLGGSVPQYLIKNILLVHNRKHPDKRMYIDGEQGIDKTDPGAQRRVHNWYQKANKMCEHNAYNIFGQSQTYTWEDVFNES